MEWNSNTECCIEGTLKTEDGDEMREAKTGRCGQGKKKKKKQRGMMEMTRKHQETPVLPETPLLPIYSEK